MSVCSLERTLFLSVSLLCPQHAFLMQKTFICECICSKQRSKRDNSIVCHAECRFYGYHSLGMCVLLIFISMK